MKKNYSDLIKDKQQRTLTAKGYKFIWRCIDVVAEQRGLSRYSKEISDLKERLKSVLLDLIIDKELSISEIKELVQQRNSLIS